MEAATAPGALATVQRCWDLSVEGRFDDVLALFDPDFVAHEAAGLPYSGEYHGRDGFAELCARMTARMDLEHRSMEFREAGAGKVVSHAVIRFTERASGRSAETSVVELYTVRDGRIIDLDIYYKDPAAVTALLA